MTTLLEAKNQILALNGLPPLTDADQRNRIGVILDAAIARCTKDVLVEAWRVFGRRIDLSPDANGQIDVSGFLRVAVPSELLDTINARNGKVWDLAEGGYYSETIEDAWVVDDMDFANIASHQWQRYIILMAAAEVAQQVNDVDANYGVIWQQAIQARRNAYNENRVNLFEGWGVNGSLWGYLV